MNIHHVLTANVALNLTDRLKGKAFDIADRSADFGNNHIRTRFTACTEHALLDFVRNMRDYLHGTAQIFSPTFLADNRRVYFPVVTLLFFDRLISMKRP